MRRRTTRATSRTSPDVTGNLAALALGVQRAGSEPDVRLVLEGLPATLERTVREVRLRPAFRIGTGRRAGIAEGLRDDLWQRFGPGTAAPFFLPSCDRLIGRGVALTRHGHEEVGLIDLLGLADYSRRPVVLQVVRGDSLGGTFAALLRAIGAVALLEHAWTAGFREQWARTLLAAGCGEPALPAVLRRTTACVVARSSHWRAIDEGARDPDSDVSTLELQRLHALVDAAALERVFVSFVDWCDRGPYASRPMAWSARLPRVGVPVAAMTTVEVSSLRKSARVER